MRSILHGVVILVCAFMLFSCARVEEMKVSNKLPGFELKDPLGKFHKSDDLYKHGLILVVTAPTLHNSGAQNGWDKYLTGKTGKATLVFLEDMEPSDFKKKALKEMKKDFHEDKPPLLLIDDDGRIRKKVGAERNATEVLVYDKKGGLIFREKGKPSDTAAKAILAKIKG